jgi:hypothetical protein
MAKGVYDKFVENAILAYSKIFSENCGSRSFQETYYDNVRERLMIELQVLYTEARGEKNVKSKISKSHAKRAVV